MAIPFLINTPVNASSYVRNLVASGSMPSTSSLMDSQDLELEVVDGDGGHEDNPYSEAAR
jgi:hypothetical protein